MYLLQANGDELAQDAVGGAEAFWAAYGNAITTLGKFSIGILVYALIVNAFYQIISHRVMFAGKTVEGHVVLKGPGHGFVYLMMFPLVSFLFFILLSMSLLYLGSDDQSAVQVFTLAMAIVLAVRIAAYFSEATSHDVAKMLPLGLLGVALVRADFTQTFAQSVRDMLEIVDHLSVIVVYFGIVVVTEYLLRGIYIIVGKARGRVHHVSKE